MSSGEERPSITNPYTTGSPPAPASPSITLPRSHQAPIQHWRQIFPKYAFEQPSRHLTPEHPPGIPSVTSISTANPTTPTPYGDPSQLQPSTFDGSNRIAPLSRTDEPENIRRNRLFLYRAAVGTCVACPIIALLPPRKFDLFTFGLGVTFFVTAGFAMEQKTGNGLMWHVGRTIPTQRNRQRWREERDGTLGSKAATSGSERLEKVKAVDKEESWGNVWKEGNSKDAWIREREAKERQVFEEGQGYGTLILDQIKEVLGIKGDDKEDEDDVEGER